MKLSEYAAYDATGLAALVRDGQVSATELHDTARTAIEAVNARLNAVAFGPWERPLDHDPDGPFAGVPFVLKDLVCHAAGVPSKMGTRLTGDGLVYDYDTHLMARFRAAGLAVLATTTSPELGFNGNCEALVYGATRNPWDTSRSVGGSSGGTGALVASGAVPLGHANDGGGSIRIPAAMNGLVGLKTSRGRVPVGPDYAEILFGLATELAHTRTVRDTAAVLDAVAGPMPGDKYVIPSPARPYVEEVGADPGRLRIAVETESWAGTPVDPEVVEAVEQTARTLESLGHAVTPDKPPLDWETFIQASATIFSVDYAGAVDAIAAMSGLPVGRETLEHTTLAAVEYARTVTATELTAALGVYNTVARDVGEFFTRYDVLLTPTTNTPPLPLGTLNANDSSFDALAWTRRIFGFNSFTLLFNVSGTPAMSIPLGATASGLPIGMQLAAGMCDEATLFRVAAQLEAAAPWSDRRPEVHVAALSTAAA